MSFTACSFTYNDISCDEFGLKVYEISDVTHGDYAFAGTVSIAEERISNAHKPLFYGVEFDRKLEFSIVFGMNDERIDLHIPMTREEEDEIATWLIGHDEYRCLIIEQDDLEDVHFNCIVSELEPIRYGMESWAMRATFVCDGPYGYKNPQIRTYELDGNRTVFFNNMGSYHGYYYPVIEYSPVSQEDLIITNMSDGGRTFQMTGLPSSVSYVMIDNSTLVITNNVDLNLYDCFNKIRFRLKRGKNELSITGRGKLTIRVEYPVNVSG